MLFRAWTDEQRLVVLNSGRLFRLMFRRNLFDVLDMVRNFQHESIFGIFWGMVIRRNPLSLAFG